MVAYVSYAEAQLHLRLDSTDDQADVELKIAAASGAVKNYLKTGQPYVIVYETDSNGDYIYDSHGDLIPELNSYGKEIPEEDSAGEFIVRDEVKQATLLLLGIFYRDRDGEEAHQWQLGYLPMAVQSLLYPLRSPAMA